MAKSRARKIRDKKVREGHRNPINSRTDWCGISPITKWTPTKRERITKLEKKYKKRNHLPPQSRNDSFFIFYLQAFPLIIPAF
ncbi:hypothetical protein [Peribacillus kribbensis]|uniref:hypothetical protein n=1 Tax=Peribacillus kribbensis TaxID=356658 RepID=UPI00041AF537|nr:hypothetical protein [Peribacillus kribbensis]